MKRTGKILSLIAVGLMMLTSLPASANVGRVMHMAGDVQVNGQPMSKIRVVKAGDQISTGANSTVMVVMTDKSVIDLQPNTKFKLEKFSFNKKKPEQGKSVMSLLSGTFRYISGLVGRTNHENAQIRMGTATAGIRGSLATFGYDGKTSNINVSLGTMTMTFADGTTMTVARGQQGQASNDGKIVEGAKENPIMAAIQALIANPTTEGAEQALAGLSDAEQAMVVAAMVANRKQLGLSKDVLKNAVNAVVQTNKAAAPLVAGIIAGIAEDKDTAESLINDIKGIDGVNDADVNTAVKLVEDDFGTLGEGDTNTVTIGEPGATTSTTGGGGGTTSP